MRIGWRRWVTPTPGIGDGGGKTTESSLLEFRGLTRESEKAARKFLRAGTSNDWFFGTSPAGISLFGADGLPMGGDVTDMLSLYDAGTEIDQEPGIRPDTGPQQMMPDQGQADPIHQVHAVPPSQSGRPASAHVRVTLMAR